jgi:hypothetical protein
MMILVVLVSGVMGMLCPRYLLGFLLGFLVGSSSVYCC